MRIKIADYKRYAKEKLGPKPLRSMLSKLKFDYKELWATEKGPHFESFMILCTLRKDLQGISYQSLLSEIEEECKIAKETLQHNVRCVREKLKAWAEDVIIPDDREKLEKAAKKVDRPPPCARVTLWVDSTDCRVKGRRHKRTDNPNWSYKLNSPGQRWVTVCNAKGLTQFISPGYPPKTYDGDIFLANRESLEDQFFGATIIGDNHFRKAEPFLHNIKLVTNVSAAGRPKKIAGKKVPTQLSKAEVKSNEAIRGVRGKVEAPYGWIKQVFLSLNQPFYEPAEQHDCVFWTALACHRMKFE